MVTAPNKGKFKVGTRFVGNVNGAEFVVVDIQKPTRNGFKVVIVKEVKHGELFTIGLGALEYMLVTILEG